VAKASIAVSVEPYDGERTELQALFELAEDSTQQLQSYQHAGCVLVARLAHNIVGYVQIVETRRPREAEIKSIAVRASHQRHGVGRALVEAAVVRARESGCSALVAATATADIGNLRFYQRMGFRMRNVDRDVFTPAAGYPPGLKADGIEVRDRVWFELPIRSRNAVRGAHE